MQSKKNKTQLFSPAGGMNQDDSIVTPTPNYAGRNAFGQGDYKYALNARIGSSRSENAGDLELIRGTVEITDYYVLGSIFANSTFQGSLNGWSQIDVGFGDWIYASNSLIISPDSEDILYQAVSVIAGQVLKFKYHYIQDVNVSGFQFKVIYLNGTSIISTQVISTDLGDQTGTADLTIPANCTGIGIQVSGSVIGLSVHVLLEASLFGWTAGVKPVGTEKVIGKYENVEFNKLYYCVHNSNGDHTIRYLDPAAGRIYEIMRWSGLNFRSTDFVKMSMIDTWLGITDRYNNPRLMDVNEISALFNTLTSTNFREYHISFHKWAPVMPPILKAYYDGATNNYKKFENKTYQFAYRYIYKGKLRSRWSPISNSAQNFLSVSGTQVTDIEIYIPGFNLDDPSAAVQYNYFGNNHMKFTSSVETIELAYRESSLDLWRILKRHDVLASGNTTFHFTGGADSTPIPIDDFSQLFDTVPILAGTIESIDNRFIFADCLEENTPGMPVQITNIGVVKYNKTNDPLGGWWNYGQNNEADAHNIFNGMSSADALELGKRNLICDTTFKGRGLYKLGIQYLAANGWRSAAYTAENFIFDIPAEVGIVDKYYALTFKFADEFLPPDWAVAYQIVRTNCLNIDYFMFGAVNSFDFLIDDTASVLGDKAQVPDYLRDRIQEHFKTAQIIGGDDIDKYLKSLKEAPFINSVYSDVRRTAVASILSDASRLYINVNNWYNASSKNAGGTANNPMNKLFYNYRQGDRVRFLASTVASPTTDQKVIYDVPILEFTGVGIVIEKPEDALWVPGMAGTVMSDFLIEVYTPKIPRQDDYVYYETGEWYPVLYPGSAQRVHSKKDWTFTNNAAITCSTYGDIKVFNNRPLSYGDCHGIDRVYYFNIRTPNTNVVVNTASMNPDPFKTFGYWEKSNGRVTPSYTDLPVVRWKPTQFRFGGQLIEQSFVNQINRFKSSDQKNFPSEYGRIRNLINTSNAQVESVGSILLAIGEREAFSIYVNRTTLEDLSGSTSVQLSDKVLGSYNTLLGSHGTLNPESVSLKNGRVYWWDASNGVWVRYGRDGLTKISAEYKMRTWFKEIGVLLRNKYGSSEEPRVICGFDAWNDELVTFIDHSTLPGTFRGYGTYKGCFFSENDKRWKSVHSYDPEMFAKLNDNFYSFKGGSLIWHEQDAAAHSTFYGVKHNVMIEPVFNEIPMSMKSWMNVAYVATHKWSADFTSEFRGSKTKQHSYLTLAQFDEREDCFYGDIRNDVNSPNVTNPLTNGNKMRSKAIRILMQLDPAVVTASLLHYVEVGEIDSPKNP